MLATLYFLECYGILTNGRLTAPAARAGAAAATLFLFANGLAAARYGESCGGLDQSTLELGAIRGAGYFAASFLAGLPAIRAGMKSLYLNPLFNRWGWPRKFIASGASALIPVLAFAGVIFFHDSAFAASCALTGPDFDDTALAAAAGFAAALIVYAFREAARAIPIEDMQVVKDHSAMLDLARYAGASNGSRRVARELIPNLAPTGEFASLRGCWLSFSVQARVRASDRFGVVICGGALLICALAVVGMGVQGHKAGAAAAAMAGGVIFTEFLAAPEMSFDPRARYSGRSLRAHVLFLSAPYVFIAFCGWAVAAVFVGTNGASIAVLFGGLAAIALRIVMRIAAWGRSSATIRVYLAAAIAALLAYQLFGPLGLVWLPAAPFQIFRSAERSLLGFSQ